jgi:hypothetical protein
MGIAAEKKVKKRKTYRVIFSIILILILLRPALVFYSQKDVFISKGYSKIYNYLESSYYSSQYVRKENPGIMPDETFEAFVGGAFLRGVNPIHIVHEHPPMGRYIIAFSILLFDNARTLVMPLLALSLAACFLIAKIVIKNSLLALVPVAIFSNDPLFISKLQYSPLLEAIQLPFILLSLYFFIRGINNEKSFRHDICSISKIANKTDILVCLDFHGVNELQFFAVLEHFDVWPDVEAF